MKHSHIIFSSQYLPSCKLERICNSPTTTTSEANISPFINIIFWLWKSFPLPWTSLHIFLLLQHEKQLCMDICITGGELCSGNGRYWKCTDPFVMHEYITNPTISSSGRDISQMIFNLLDISQMAWGQVCATHQLAVDLSWWGWEDTFTKVGRWAGN